MWEIISNNKNWIETYTIDWLIDPKGNLGNNTLKMYVCTSAQNSSPTFSFLYSERASPIFTCSRSLSIFFLCCSVLPPPPHAAQPTCAPVQYEVSQTIPHQTMENIRLLLPLLPVESPVRSNWVQGRRSIVIAELESQQRFISNISWLWDATKKYRYGMFIKTSKKAGFYNSWIFFWCYVSYHKCVRFRLKASYLVLSSWAIDICLCSHTCIQFLYPSTSWPLLLRVGSSFERLGLKRSCWNTRATLY